MARSKKEPIEVLEEDLELLDESVEEETIEPAAIDSNEAEEEVAAPKKKRKPRAKKAPTRKIAAKAEEEEEEIEMPSEKPDAVDEIESSDAEESEDETVISGTEILNAAPKKRPTTKLVKETEQADHLREDAAIASAGLEKSMESMAKQWVSIQQISGSICTSLERVSEMLGEIPAQMEAMRPPTTRPAPITKIAVGMSGLAILLSILSISFSQSVRQNVLSHEAVASAPKPAARVASSKPTPPPVNEAPAEPTPEITPKAPPAAPLSGIKPPGKEEKRSDLTTQIEKVEAKLAAETAAKKKTRKSVGKRR